MTLPKGQYHWHQESEMAGWSEEELERLERVHAEGMSVQQIVDAFTARGSRLTEATFRKYVQLGLLPRDRKSVV